MIGVEIVKGVTPQLVDSIGALVSDLSETAARPTAEAITTIVTSPVTTLFVARDATDRVIGMLTLVVFLIPTGRRAFIEDVVVAMKVRRSGVGEALTRAALAECEIRGVRTVDLTSRSSRQAANSLYEKVGFIRRETNVYRITCNKG